MMNPIVLEIGPLTLHAFAAWLLGGALAGLAILGWRGYAYRRAREDVARWIDPGLAAVVAGVVGARALHVALDWDYFSAHTDLITDFASGGLAWHGALILGLPAALLAAMWRRVPLRPWTDALALAFPLGMAAAWLACRDAGCSYGYEVRTLADWPALVVEELPDVFGIVAPRLDVQLAGVALSGVLFLVALFLTLTGWLRGVRLWLVLALAGLGLALSGFFRADPSQTLWNRRVDQVLDLAVLAGATVTGGWVWLAGKRSAPPDSDPHRDIHHDTHHDTQGEAPGAPMEVNPYEAEDRAGPV